MNYIIFGLGVVLAAAGCLSIYGGYDIIQVERGWTEVIAGATAVSGGVVTIALSMILRRLEGLTAVYEASRHAPAPNHVTVEPAAADLAAANLAPLALNARSSDAGTARDVPGAEPADALAPAAIAAFDAIELHDVDSFMEPATAVEKPQPSAAALSLDEMWKRVSEEIARPILSPEPEAAAIEHPVHSDAKGEAPNVLLPDAKAGELTPLVEPATVSAAEAPAAPHIEDVWPLAENPEAEPFSAASAQFPATHHAAPPADPQDMPYMPPPAVEPPIAEPAVIGRYEAEGTAYLMFDDGSIEAQSEAGIFRFASMADLKAFIEDKQAAEV